MSSMAARLDLIHEVATEALGALSELTAGADDPMLVHIASLQDRMVDVLRYATPKEGGHAPRRRRPTHGTPMTGLEVALHA